MGLRLKLLLPLLIYSDRIIARQFWSSLILILLSPCQNWLLLLFYFSDLPVRTVAAPLLAKFLAKLQARFWAKFSGKFPVNCNETYVHENATFNSYTYYRILIDWVCSAYSHVGAFSELWKIEQDIFLSSEVDEFITCAAKFFISFPRWTYLHKVCPSIKHSRFLPLSLWVGKWPILFWKTLTIVVLIWKDKN